MTTCCRRAVHWPPIAALSESVGANHPILPKRIILAIPGSEVFALGSWPLRMRPEERAALRRSFRRDFRAKTPYL